MDGVENRGRGRGGRGLVSLLSLGLAAVGALGCNAEGAQGGCPALPVCGGNPAGTWMVTSRCEYEAVRPPQATDVVEFTGMTGPAAPTLPPPQPSPVVLQQTTSGDWCSSLVINPDGTVSNANLWHDAPALVSGSISLIAADHSYLTTLTFSTQDYSVDRNTTHFAPHCLVANGGNPTCDQLTAGLTAFYAPQMPGVPANFASIACAAASDGGCDCTAVYNVQVADMGNWAVDQTDPTTLLQDSTVFTYNGVVAGGASPASTLRTSFCVEKGALELSGQRGGSLDNLLGLRTMTLAPMP
jgi:hypothetical protein